MLCVLAFPCVSVFCFFLVKFIPFLVPCWLNLQEGTKYKNACRSRNRGFLSSMGQTTGAQVVLFLKLNTVNKKNNDDQTNHGNRSNHGDNYPPTNYHGSAKRPTNQEENRVFQQGSVRLPILAAGRVYDLSWRGSTRQTLTSC